MRKRVWEYLKDFLFKVNKKNKNARNTQKSDRKKMEKEKVNTSEGKRMDNEFA